MAGYTKLFHSILASTIWRADDQTRIVWITLLAMADKQGVAEASIPGLADLARVSIPDCQRALEALSSPDEWSRSTEVDGRRIEPVEGGWRLINHGKYRAKMGADERREYLRLKQREYRGRRRQHTSTNVNNVSDTDTRLTHTEAKAEADTQAIRTRTIVDCVDFDRFWAAYPKRVGKDAARKAWRVKHPSLPVVLAALERQRAWLQRDGGRYIPNPATWLNQGRWDDDPPVAAPPLGKQSSRLLAAVANMKDTL